RLELSPDTTLRLDVVGGPGAADVGKQVYLVTGLVHADVTRQPGDRPMLLRTPHAVIRVLGTRFLSAALPEGHRVELEGGLVEMTQTADGRSVVLEKDRFAQTASQPGPLLVQSLPPRVTRSRILHHDPAQPPLSAAVSPDGKTLALGSRDG